MSTASKAEGWSSAFTAGHATRLVVSGTSAVSVWLRMSKSWAVGLCCLAPVLTTKSRVCHKYKSQIPTSFEVPTGDSQKEKGTLSGMWFHITVILIPRYQI